MVICVGEQRTQSCTHLMDAGHVTFASLVGVARSVAGSKLQLMACSSSAQAVSNVTIAPVNKQNKGNSRREDEQQ